ncbi:Uma2 family endonuclease [Streptomyces sp. NPDC059740]|uniref:Uma2 family endonuclease n=1 Tax=Streptomyces sp. NPDC059740 TaxID=3346926 RepID=UPI003652050B
MSAVPTDHTGPWTLSDVLALPQDARQRVELVGGSLMMSPAPGIPHQRASRRLAALLEAAADADGGALEVLEAINVVVPDGLLIPDIAVVDAEAAATAGLTLPTHDVLLVVEIASPSPRLADRRLKPSLYADAGVPHYWRLDLDPAPRLHLGRLRGRGYEEHTVVAGQRTRVRKPFEVWVDPGALAGR